MERGTLSLRYTGRRDDDGERDNKAEACICFHNFTHLFIRARCCHMPMLQNILIKSIRSQKIRVADQERLRRIFVQ